MNNNELREGLALAIQKSLGVQWDAKPVPGREWDPDSWTATGGIIDLTVIADAALAYIRKHDSHADQKERLDTAEHALLAHGYRKSCGIPACNCGDQWNHGGHAMERLSGIEAATADYYRNGELLLTRAERIVAIADGHAEFVQAVRARAMQISFTDAIVGMCDAELAKEQS